jgi:hypothetical protein
VLLWAPLYCTNYLISFSFLFFFRCNLLSYLSSCLCFPKFIWGSRSCNVC